MVEEQTPYKRSVQNVLINRPMQREFTLVMLGIMMTAALVVGVVIHYTLHGMMDGTPSTLSRTALERMVYDANSQLIVVSVLVIFLAVIATGFFGVFFLHRVAGPVFRFRQVLRRMGSGEIPAEIQLRRRDFFKETADELNRVIKLLSEFDEASKELNGMLNELSRQDVSQNVSANIQKIKSKLGRFKRIKE